MPYKETGKEKAKREDYYKANKERGIRQEAERDYKMFGTTEQNIPQVNPMGDVTTPAAPTGMKRGGKVRKMSAGGNPIYNEWSKTPPNAKTSDSDNMGGLKPAPDNMGGIKPAPQGKKKGGVIRSSASARADGCAIRGKTRA